MGHRLSIIDGVSVIYTSFLSNLYLSYPMFPFPISFDQTN